MGIEMRERRREDDRATEECVRYSYCFHSSRKTSRKRTQDVRDEEGESIRRTDLEAEHRPYVVDGESASRRRHILG